MTPNLRFNKKLTKQLIKAIPDEEEKVSLLHLKWNMDNGNNIYGLAIEGWLRSKIFYLQRIDEDRFRLVSSEGPGFYIIDDIEEFLQVVGVRRLEFTDDSEIKQALEEAVVFPNTGIILIEDGKIFVYDHENYE